MRRPERPASQAGLHSQSAQVSVLPLLVPPEQQPKVPALPPLQVQS